MDNGNSSAPTRKGETCRCSDFATAATALDYDFAIAGCPLDLPPTFRYVADCPCGNALALHPLDSLQRVLLGQRPQLAGV